MEGSTTAEAYHGKSNGKLGTPEVVCGRTPVGRYWFSVGQYGTEKEPL